MKRYLAPMEGLTNYMYRGTLERHFGQVDKYFTPFFRPHTKRSMKSKEVSDILRENNEGVCLVPQILTNSAEDVLNFERDMHAYGYPEVNINLGCPSNTVFNKGRGAGMLRDTEALDRFLSDIYEKNTGPISVKTRLGVSDPEEFYRLLEIYNRYPMEELIIHVRVREEFYKGLPHQELFLYALENSKNPLCYNGDIWTPEDLSAICSLAEKTGKEIPSVMAGRGAIANPALFRELAGGPALKDQELSAFLGDLRREYEANFSGDISVLYKMKEAWSYLIRRYPGKEKLYKKILKTKHLEEYMVLENMILDQF